MSSDLPQALPFGDEAEIRRRVDPAYWCPKFRLQSQERGGGEYWTLMAGSAKERVSLSLGAMTIEDARRYLAGMEGARALWHLHLMWTKQQFGGEMIPDPDVLRLVLPHVDAEGQFCFDPDSPLRMIEAARQERHRAAVLAFLYALGGQGNVLATLTEKGAQPELRVTSLTREGPLTAGMMAVMTLKDFHDRVWAPIREKNVPITWAVETFLWKNQLLPGLGHVRMRDLNSATFDRFMSSVTLMDGSAPSRSTKFRLSQAYKAMLKEARLQGIEEIKAHVYRALPEEPEDDEEEFGVITEEELGKLCDAVRKHQPMADRKTVQGDGTLHAALFCYLFGTGCRPAEAGKADWRLVDFTPSDKAPHGRVRIRGTKTAKSNDVIPMTRLVSESLQALWLRLGKPTTGPIFVWKGQPIGSFKTALATAAKHAKLTKRIYPNLFRHSYATLLLEQGASPEVVADLLRHTSPEMVKRIYGHAKVADRVDVSKIAAFEKW